VLKPFVGYVSLAREHNTFADRLSSWQRMIDRVLSRLSYAIVAVSSTVAEFTSAQEGIPRDKFFVIHNGVDLDKAQHELNTLPSKNELKKELGFSQANTILLNIARLTHQKNHQLLIDGFAGFFKAHPEYTLVIVGSGKLRKELEAYAHIKGVGGVVVFFGHRDDVWRFYKMADAFVSTSQIEGLSNAYLEACAASLPLVATNTAGTDELLRDGENGYIISEQTPQAVVHALLRLQSSDLQALGIAARETAERFSIQRAVNQYEGLFINAIQSR
jgi:glycosyltransferase involved in cell wall biosynthesis